MHASYLGAEDLWHDTIVNFILVTLVTGRLIGAVRPYSHQSYCLLLIVAWVVLVSSLLVRKRT